ncbi:hypothetical protein [Streptomyces sp. H51]|uniref:hypothetical protein n=1 Tax=Streptomyces sp. H51 TaxID=3111770 RepID=UPI002D78AAA8|nr:hypothetical protein [Streptomyces sp. H51]
MTSAAAPLGSSFTTTARTPRCWADHQRYPATNAHALTTVVRAMATFLALPPSGKRLVQRVM